MIFCRWSNNQWHPDEFSLTPCWSSSVSIPNWAAVTVFALAFGESLPFVSLIFPFWAILVGIGAIIVAADIFWLIVAAAGVGAALGDWLPIGSATSITNRSRGYGR
jgi:hypothetical protein